MDAMTSLKINSLAKVVEDHQQRITALESDERSNRTRRPRKGADDMSETLLEMYRRHHGHWMYAGLIAEIERVQTMLDELLNHCPDMECPDCGKIVCPHKDTFHFHHDGCPSCATKEPTT